MTRKRLLLYVGLVLACATAIGAGEQVGREEFGALALRVAQLEQRVSVLEKMAASAQNVEGGGTITDLSLLEGAVIVADDGKFLGRITTNQFATDSILNQFGSHGSMFSTDSIFNTFGTYGNELSALSAFNELAVRPPTIFKGDKFVAYLSVNSTKTPRVDTRRLIAWLKSAK